MRCETPFLPKVSTNPPIEHINDSGGHMVMETQIIVMTECNASMVALV